MKSLLPPLNILLCLPCVPILSGLEERRYTASPWIVPAIWTSKHIALPSARTALVCIQWANNETGVVFPVALLASMAHEAGALFHCDAVQAAGKVAIDVHAAEIDMLSISAHKMHGPKGAGALYVRNGVRFAPLVHGGRQERGR